MDKHGSRGPAILSRITSMCKPIVLSGEDWRIEYEFGYICKCRLGQNASNRIMVVPDGLVGKLSEKNFDEFKGIYPELVMELG